MVSVSSNFKWNPGAKNKILEAPNNITYGIAQITLDLSFNHIPLSKGKGRGKLRQTSKSAGVRGTDGDYYIGSYTNYAKYVWVMPKSTNWSEPGTFGKWYEETWKKQNKTIAKLAIDKGGLE